MAKMYRYRKMSTPYTTITIDLPEGSFEHGEIDGLTYISIPDSTILNPPEEITTLKDISKLNATQKTEYDTVILKKLKKLSMHNQLINDRVVLKIEEKYSTNDQIKILRRKEKDLATFTEMDTYIEECRAWGDLEKAKMGF
jgi:hypothetical protein